MNIFFKLFIRNLSKRKIPSLINLLGLVLAFIVCINAYTYIKYELSYDQHLPNYDNLYRLKSQTSTNFPIGYDQYLKDKIPQIRNITSFWKLNSVLSSGNKSFQVDNIYSTDSSFFNIFNLKQLKGDLNQFSSNPFTIIISESLSKKLFSNQDPIGKTIRSNKEVSYLVIGIIKDYPLNSNVRPNAIIPLESLRFIRKWAFNNSSSHLTQIFIETGLGKEYIDSQLNQLTTNDEFTRKHITNKRLTLESIGEIHLNSKSFHDNNSRQYINLIIISIISFIILSIAIFNHINLSIANNITRLKEVCIKKLLGRNRTLLIFGLIIESIFFSAFAIILALFFSDILALKISSFFNLHYYFKEISFTELYIFLFILNIVSGIISGIYPAIILSNFNLINGIKTKFSISIISRNKRFQLKQFLLGIQFFVSICLIIMTIVMFSQYKYLTKKDIGIDTHNTIAIETPPYENTFYANVAISQRLKSSPDVKFVTATNQIPSGGIWWTKKWKGIFNNKKIEQNISLICLNNDFLQKTKVKLIKGKLFDTIFTKNNTNKCIINKALYNILGDNCIGKNIDCFWDTDKRKIIGVVDNILYSSLHKELYPCAYYTYPKTDSCYKRFLYIKFHNGNMNEHIKMIKSEWSAIVPDWPINYHIIDNDLEAMYLKEKYNMSFIAGLSVIAIVICFIGTLGYIIFNMEIRTKEIGIRITLGASTFDIIRKVSYEFFFLTLISWLIAIPVAYQICYYWLDNFNEHINITPIPFIEAGSTMLIICFLTVSYQVYKNTKQNPINALASE